MEFFFPTFDRWDGFSQQTWLFNQETGDFSCWVLGGFASHLWRVWIPRKIPKNIAMMVDIVYPPKKIHEISHDLRVIFTVFCFLAQMTWRGKDQTETLLTRKRYMHV